MTTRNLNCAKAQSPLISGPSMATISTLQCLLFLLFFLLGDLDRDLRFLDSTGDRDLDLADCRLGDRDRCLWRFGVLDRDFLDLPDGESEYSRMAARGDGSAELFLDLLSDTGDPDPEPPFLLGLRDRLRLCLRLCLGEFSSLSSDELSPSLSLSLSRAFS